MSVFPYLKLQPIDPQDDGSTSDLDSYEADETIDLSQDEDGEALVQEWDEIVQSLHPAEPATIAIADDSRDE